MIICKLDAAIYRKITLFMQNIWWGRKNAVLLHRFSMTPALKVRHSKAGSLRIGANEKRYWSLK